MSNCIADCTHYMFTNDNLKKFPEIKQKHQPTPKKKDKVIKKLPDLFIPRYRDTLFWCFYIIIKGWEEFFFVGRKNFMIEKEYKIKCIELLRISKDILKKNRWRKNALENELINEKNISIGTFVCLCAIYNINITVITNHYYYVYTCDSCKPIWYIKQSDDRFGLYTGKIASLLENLKMTWQIDNLKKPLKGISSYKIGELKSICKKLKINTSPQTGRFNKCELYKLIQSKIE